MDFIPAIDIRGGYCVRLKQGDFYQETLFSEDPVATAMRWLEAGARRLHIVDLDGARGQSTTKDVIRSRIREVRKQFGDE